MALLSEVSSVSVQEMLEWARGHDMYKTELAAVHHFQLCPIISRQCYVRRLREHAKTRPSGLCWTQMAEDLIPIDTKEGKFMRLRLLQNLIKHGLVSKETVAVNVLQLRALNHLAYHFQDFCDRAGGTSLLLGDCPVSEVIEYAVEFSANTLFGTATRLISLANYVVQSKSPKLNVQTIIIVGNVIGPSQKSTLLSVFNPRQLVFCLWTAEIGVWAYQSQLTGPTEFHFLPELTLLEESRACHEFLDEQ